MRFQSPGAGDHWPAQAVHDTVAAIMRDAAYRRSLSESLWDRFWAWVGRIFGDVLASVRGSTPLRYGLLAAAILLVLVVVARIIVNRRAQTAADAAIVAARRVVRGDPFADAERAAAEGRYTDAAHALYQAVLDSLARGARVRIHRAKTTGDYARELRMSGSPSYGAFRSFGRMFDRIIFGRGECDESGYRALLEQAKPLVTAEERAA